MELKDFGNGPLQPGPVDQVKGLVFSGKELQGLGADIFHHLLGLGAGETPGPNFLET
jgi:hypothetical protein